MNKLLKKYLSKDEQSDIFGAKYNFVSRLHKTACSQYPKLISIAAGVLISRLRFKKYAFNAKAMENLLISVDPEQGRLLYNLVLTAKPKTVFEFGLSYGVSALYICQALKNLGSGKLYSSEVIDKKIKQAQYNLTQMELYNLCNIIDGDLLREDTNIPDNIDFVHMDGFPNINLQVLKKIEDKLALNSIIITDDINIFKNEMSDYLEYLEKSPNYTSTKLNISDGVLLTVKHQA